MDRAALMEWNRRVAAKLRRYLWWDWGVVPLSFGLSLGSGALAVWPGAGGVRRELRGA